MPATSRRGLTVLVVVLLALAILAVVLLWWWPARRAERRAHATASPATPTLATAARSGSGSERAPDASGSAGPGYAISVKLSRDHICKNEEVRVQVAARGPEGDDPWLVPAVSFAGGEPVGGHDVVVRPPTAFLEAYTPQDASARVVVALQDRRSNQVVARQEVDLIVDDCVAPQGGLRVDCTVGYHEASELLCAATPWDEGGLSRWKGTSFSWKVLAPTALPATTTPIPQLRMTLPVVAETTPTTDFIVEVVARDDSGKERHGLASYVRSNERFITASQTGTMLLEVTHPAVPDLADRSKTYELPVTVTNEFAEDVRLERAEITTIPCAPPGRSATPSTQPGEVGSLLAGRTLIGAGERLSTVWRLPNDAARCSAQVKLTGISLTSHRPVIASWTMLTDPTARKPLTGSGLARFKKAMEILSQRRGTRVTRVTQAELDDLEQEGLIPPLPPEEDPGLQAPPTTPPPLPR